MEKPGHLFGDKIYEKIYDKALNEAYLKQTKYESIMNGLLEHLFVAEYNIRYIL